MDADTLLANFAKRVQYWNDFFGMTTADMQFAVAYRADLQSEAPSTTYDRRITTFTLGPKSFAWDEKKTDLIAFTSVFAVFTTVVNGYGIAAFSGDKFKDSDSYKETNERYKKLRYRLLLMAQLFVWPIAASGQADAQIAELMRSDADETTGSD